MVESFIAAQQPASLDQVFHALSDATRRAILRDITRGEKTVGEIAGPYAMSLAAVSKHLDVLERASLIRRERQGAHRLVRLNPSRSNPRRTGSPSTSSSGATASTACRSCSERSPEPEPECAKPATIAPPQEIETHARRSAMRITTCPTPIPPISACTSTSASPPRASQIFEAWTNPELLQTLDRAREHDRASCLPRTAPRRRLPHRDEGHRRGPQRRSASAQAKIPSSSPRASTPGWCRATSSLTPGPAAGTPPKSPTSPLASSKKSAGPCHPRPHRLPQPAVAAVHHSGWQSSLTKLRAALHGCLTGFDACAPRISD